MNRQRHPQSRDTVSRELAVVLSHEFRDGDQNVMRLHAPAIARDALPGNFVHLVCHPMLPLRRPMSIMRASPEDGWIDILYKVHGQGTRLLASRDINESIDLLGPIGIPFRPDRARKRPLLIGGGVGIPPMVFLAEHLLNQEADFRPLVIMGSEVPFPFPARPSGIMSQAWPDGVIATMPLLEDWGIPCRLATQQGYAGCFDGVVTDLARHWLGQLDAAVLGEVEIFACGPGAMLEAVAGLAREAGLPCQVSLEEYMACGIGGCAGCTVRTESAAGPAMKRVCVDGPVFAAETVFP